VTRMSIWWKVSFSPATISMALVLALVAGAGAYAAKSVPTLGHGLDPIPGDDGIAVYHGLDPIPGDDGLVQSHGLDPIPGDDGLA
jgi:hypothetical protein